MLKWSRLYGSLNEASWTSCWTAAHNMEAILSMVRSDGKAMVRSYVEKLYQSYSEKLYAEKPC